LTRKIGEGLNIGPSIRVVVIEIRGGSVRLGIEAPEGVLIHRDEVLARIAEENRKATTSSQETVNRLANVRPTPLSEEDR
jgi:carbon storage regulator